MCIWLTWGSCYKGPDLLSLRCNLIFCIYNKFWGEANADGPRATLSIQTQYIVWMLIATEWPRKVECGKEQDGVEILFLWDYSHSGSHTDLTMSHGHYHPDTHFSLEGTPLRHAHAKASGIPCFSHQKPNEVYDFTAVKKTRSSWMLSSFCLFS